MPTHLDADLAQIGVKNGLVGAGDGRNLQRHHAILSIQLRARVTKDGQ
jgi:hypothetical protein